MKVLYLFAGNRSHKFTGEIHRDYPDTQFYGLNHLKNFGIEATYKELPLWLEKILSFNLKHVFMFFYTFGYDVVFGSALLNTVLLKKIFRTKTKFVLLNISLSRLLRSNADKPFRMKIIRWLLEDIDHIVCLSTSQRDYLVNEGFKQKDAVTFIPLGVDEVFFEAVYEGRSDVLLALGRDNGRDYKTVLQVAKHLPHRQFEIICSSRNLLGIPSIPDNVTVHYDVPPDVLKEKYASAQALLLITKDDTVNDGADCSGQTVLLDAFASGLPVIASRKECVTDYADDGKEVSLVNFYDADDIIRAIDELENKDLRDALARNARRKVEGAFSTRAMAEQLQIIFYRLHEK